MRFSGGMPDLTAPTTTRVSALTISLIVPLSHPVAIVAMGVTTKPVADQSWLAMYAISINLRSTASSSASKPVNFRCVGMMQEHCSIASWTVSQIFGVTTGWAGDRGNAGT
jgi:hypothetical protein